MPPLSKAESCYFIAFCLIALAIITAFLVVETTPTCWEQYPTEQQAIEMCEEHPNE